MQRNLMAVTTTTMMVMCVCIYGWMNEMNDRISVNSADAVNYYAGRTGSDGKCVWWRRVCCVLLYLFDICWQFVPRVILPDVKFNVRVHCWTRAPRLFKQIFTGFRVSPRWLYPPGTYSIIGHRWTIKCLLYKCYFSLDSERLLPCCISKRAFVTLLAMYVTSAQRVTPDSDGKSDSFLCISLSNG